LLVFRLPLEIKVSIPLRRSYRSRGSRVHRAVVEKREDDLFRLLGEEVLLELDAELLAQALELVEVLLVLALVLDLGLDALEDADGSGIVVDSSGGLEGGDDD
jgi:hypothetical protein